MHRVTTMKMLFTAVLGILAVSGCTHIQLQKNVNRQTRTVSDIYEQQVLDNLARFVNNPYATPFFAVPDQASNGVTDQGMLAISDAGLTSHFWDHVSGGGSRQIEQSFIFKPVTSPQRLHLMQCAYQRAVGMEIGQCDKCCEYFAAWTGKSDGCDDPCGITCGWVCQSDCWKDVPKCCCDKYAKSCGTYVWVEPCYRNEFSKLVMRIIEYAAGEQAPAPDTKEVTFYLNADGKLGRYGNQAQEVRATVNQDATLEDIEDSLKIHAKIKTLQTWVGRLQSSNTLDSKKDLLKAAQTELLGPQFARADAINGFDEEKTDKEINVTIDRIEHDISQSQIRQQSINENIKPRTHVIDFGPPTQFNSAYGGGILQLQQRLDSTSTRRNR